MKKLANYMIALIPAIIGFVLIVTNLFYSLDMMLCDPLYSQMNGTGDLIKIIRVDEETLTAYGPFNGFIREKSADLIDYLYQDQELAPSVLAFDIMFVGENEDDVDDRLAKSAKSANGIVMGSNLVYRGRVTYDQSGNPYYDGLNIDMEERPYAMLDRSCEVGFTNTTISKDGFIRTAQADAWVDGTKRYSFAATVCQAYEKSLGVSNLVLPEGLFHFFYSGKPGEFSAYSMKDVLDGTIPREEFAGSIVLVGAYAPGMQDDYHSAAKRGKTMYGVEIHANIIKAIMNSKTAVPASLLLVAIVSCLVLFLYTLCARQMKMYPALIVGVWIILLQGIAGRILATHGYLIPQIYMILLVLLIMAWIVIEKYVLETIKRRRVLNSFKKYMAPQVIDQLSKDGDFHVELGGEKKRVAVLFVDIRGFTTMSESLMPEEVVKILNRYLSAMTNCIFEQGGMLDKFIGDAAMAIFNAPADQEDYLYKAVCAGLAMQRQGRILGDELYELYGKKVSFGVGVHVGDAVVGNIGSESRMDYTAIGDTVNTASRIEGKALPGEVLISEEVYILLKDRIDASFKSSMELKGKKEPVKVYQVNGEKAQ